ncbi:HNH/ENDO VII family nuclease, partial [Aliivibrio fischeri]
SSVVEYEKKYGQVAHTNKPKWVSNASYGNDLNFIKGYVKHSENRDLSGVLSITPQGQALLGVASGVDAIKASLIEFSETGSVVGAAKIAGRVALEKYAERKIKLHSGARKTFDKEIEWQATREKGTKLKYKIVQRNDIDWERIRTSGDKRYIGKTNLEAANKGGLPPQLPDGSFATLHHLGQKNTGPLVEASTRYHGVGKYGQDALHSQYGRSKPHPTLQPDRKKFAVDDREYWKVRDK